MKTKTCSKCKQKLPIGMFSKHRRTPDGLCYWCKTCMGGAVKAWNKKNRDYKNWYNREHSDVKYHREHYRKHRNKPRRPKK